MLYTVYGLHEAGKPEEIQYVGMTEQKPRQRLTGHIAARKGHFPVNRWIAKLFQERKQVECRIFMQTEDSEMASQVEAELVGYFAKRDGPLHNVHYNPRPLEKALADVEKALSVVQAKIADGSLDIQAWLRATEWGSVNFIHSSFPVP